MKAKYIKNGNIPSMIIDQIKENIIHHELKPGDKLPSERELAEMFSVSRTSVREALRSLEIIGIINTAWGDGSYISHDIEDSLTKSIDMLFSISGHSHEQVFQLRRAVEVETISQAAKRAKKMDVEKLKGILDKMEMASTEQEGAEYDREFHNEIARLSGNLFFINLLKSISNIMLSFIMQAREKVIITVNMPIIKEQHMEMLHAIEANDDKMARKVMLKHLKTIEKYYIKSLALPKSMSEDECL